MSAVVHGGLDEEERAALERSGVAVVDLSANLHPDGPPPEVLEALREVDVTRYPAADGAPLRDALAALHEVPRECVVVTPGAAAAIYLAAATLLRPGDRCAIVEPTFGEYAPAARAAGADVVRLEAAPPAFVLPPPAGSPAALTVLCNPDNPTGRYLDRDAVEALARRSRHLLLDAAYEPLAEGRWNSAALVRDGAPVTVVHSLTKAFAMPGVRLGYVVATPEVARAIEARQAPWPLGSHTIAAGLAALAVRDRVLASVDALHARRRRLEAALRDAGVVIADSRTNFVLAEVGDGARFRAAMLPRGFAVRDAASFGLPAWVRIAVPREQHLEALLHALPTALEAARAAHA